MAEERRRASRGGDKKNGNDLPSGEPAQVNGECKKNKFAFDASYKQESNANGKAAASMAGGNSFPGWPVVVAVGLSLVAALLVGCTAAVAATAKLSQVLRSSVLWISDCRWMRRLSNAEVQSATSSVKNDVTSTPG
eukprot:GHVT01087244.1.p1 GENE.GHVT01087244.1~~GHVT01087244.1.p1  ORF type:complete len:136 (+),score=36.95 GHVT01087244.1:1565-1972(+)